MRVISAVHPSLIPLDPRPHRHEAAYDANGNIVLPPEERKEPAVIRHAETAPPPPPHAPPEQNIGRQSRKIAWQETPKKQERSQPLKATLHSIQSETTHHAEAIFAEGMRQYTWSWNALLDSGSALASATKTGSDSLWNFLTQPVWIVRPRKEPRRYSRMTLFLLDTVRFGGTFAALFVLLFVTLNYQSFWEIISARMNPLEDVASDSPLADGQGALIREKLLKSPSLAVSGGADGDLLAFLPQVGPPENRLIIPKLRLNIPIVEAPIDALLKEDWSKVESDIQESLQRGVVHYPGTAKAGQAGNFFVTGHSSYYPWSPGKFKTVFARLGDLQPGDEYWVYYGGDKHRYTVTDKKEVKPSNVDVLNQPVGKRTSTLMTCTPVGTTLRRLIITADEVDPVTGIALEVGEQPARELPEIKMEVLPI